jgi:hypothetical protein
VTYLLKAGIAEREETAIAWRQQPKEPAFAKQWLCNHVSVATYTDETLEELLEKKQTRIEELLEAVFSMRSAPRLYTADGNGAASVSES